MPGLVSVAVCTWNRAELLEQTLAGLCALRVPDGHSWELLVVDNNCTDRTADVVRAFEGRLPVRRVAEPEQGLSRARNRALDEARAELLAFTDDDVLVDPGWLTALVTAARRFPHAGSFGGPIEPWFQLEPDPLLAEVFPSLRNGFAGIDHGFDEGLLPDHLDVYGASFAVNRRLAGTMRFDPHLGVVGNVPKGGEEIWFTRMLRQRGLPCVWSPGMRVRHYVDPERMTLRYLRRFTRERSRSRVYSVDLTPALPFLGAPRWAIGRLLQLEWTEMKLRLVGERHAHLVAIRELEAWRGTLAEAFRLHWARAVPSSAGPTTERAIAGIGAKSR